MSHLITTQTKVTQKDIAIQALRRNQWEFLDQGTSLKVQSGPMRGATIDLKTGAVKGDSDYLSKDSLCGLNNTYAEVLIEDTVRRNSGSIESRVVCADGSIEIVAQVMLA